MFYTCTSLYYLDVYVDVKFNAKAAANLHYSLSKIRYLGRNEGRETES